MAGQSEMGSIPWSEGEGEGGFGTSGVGSRRAGQQGVPANAGVDAPAAAGAASRRGLPSMLARGPSLVGESRLIDSRRSFQDALREALARAAGHGAAEITMCDVDYAQWPLGEVGVVASLTSWAFAHRKLVLYAHDFDDVVRRHPRWVQWRRDWSHVVECRSLAELEPSQVPSLLLASGVVAVRMFDSVRFRGSWSAQQVDLQAARETVAELEPRSVAAFPATTLGL